MAHVESHKAHILLTSGRVQKERGLSHARYSVDVSGWRDPGGNAELVRTCADGRDAKVKAWIAVDSRLAATLTAMELLVRSFLDPKSTVNYLTVGFYDRTGKWISPAIAEIVADRLCEIGYDVNVRHDFLA